MSDASAEILKNGCDFILSSPDLKPNQPTPGKTHCNTAVITVALAMGCEELKGIADDIYAIMIKNTSGRWARASGSEAAIHALGGNLAIAGMPSTRLKEDHGHVAVVYPVGMQPSGSLGHDVPMLANVGKKVGLMKSSEAFSVDIGEAYYFKWA